MKRKRTPRVYAALGATAVGFALLVAGLDSDVRAGHIRVIVRPPAATGTPEPQWPGGVRDLNAPFQAEDFGLDGEGQSYHDRDAANRFGAYRPYEGVDIQATDGGGFHVSAAAGEWLGYPVEPGRVTPGTYVLQVRVASKGTGGLFHIALGSTNLTGSVRVPDTLGWQTWHTLSRRVTIAGPVTANLLRLVMDGNGSTAGVVGNFNYFSLAPVRSAPEPSPTAPDPDSGLELVPEPSSYQFAAGTIQAESFEPIHEDTGYFDTDPENRGGAYRPNEGVDIGQASDLGGGYYVGWTKAGEWLEYAWVNVVPLWYMSDGFFVDPGDYVLRVRVASAGPGGTFHIEVAGVDKTGSLHVPDTGGSQKWKTISVPVTVDPGTWKVRLVMDANGPNGSVGNFNHFTFDPGPFGNVPVPGTPTPTPAPTPRPSATPLP